MIDHRSTTNDPLPENHVIKDISRGSFLVQYLINDQDLDDRGSRKVPLVQKLVQWIFRGKEISHESNKKTNNQSYNQFEENIFSDFFRNDSNLESHFSQWYKFLLCFFYQTNERVNSFAWRDCQSLERRKKCHHITLDSILLLIFTMSKGRKVMEMNREKGESVLWSVIVDWLSIVHNSRFDCDPRYFFSVSYSPSFCYLFSIQDYTEKATE